MAELADALVLGSSVQDVQVQVLLAAYIKKPCIVAGFAIMHGFLYVQTKELNNGTFTILTAWICKSLQKV